MGSLFFAILIHLVLVASYLSENLKRYFEQSQSKDNIRNLNIYETTNRGLSNSSLSLSPIASPTSEPSLSEQQTNLQIECFKHDFYGSQCVNYISQWLQSYTGYITSSDTQSVYGDLPAQGYSKSVTPMDVDGFHNPIMHLAKINGTDDVKFTSLTVHVYAELTSVEGINQMEGTFSAGVSMLVMWIDHRLAWNYLKTSLVDPDASYYGTIGGSSPVLLPFESVWTPDIEVINAALPSDSMLIWSPTLQIYPSGVIYGILKAPNLQTRCSLSLAKFPFDEHTCEISFASKSTVVPYGYALTWCTSLDCAMSQSKTLKDAQNSAFEASTSWELLNYNFSREFKDLFYNSENYGKLFNPQAVNYALVFQSATILNLYISVRRYPHYYVVTAVIPSLIMAFIVILSLWIPDQATKAAIIITSILGLIAVGWVVGASMPYTESSTWMDTLILSCLFVSFFAIVFVVLEYYISYLRVPFPPWLYHLIKCECCIKQVSPAYEVDEEALIKKATPLDEENNIKWRELSLLVSIFLRIILLIGAIVFWSILFHDVKMSSLDVSATK